MQALPEDIEAWKRRADWVHRRFDSPSKRAVSGLGQILEFINGDTSESTLTHWCVPGCCKDDADCLAKALHLLVPWFGRGFSVPLLSRFKHYMPASAYVTVGCLLCNLLPQALKNMQETSTENSDLRCLVETLLADTNFEAKHTMSEEDLQLLVGGLMEADMNYSVQNSIRKGMMIKFICSETFPRNAVVVDCLLQPIEIGVNKLFSRTKLLHTLTNLSTCHPDYEQLCQSSRARFLSIVDGSMGREIMGQYKRVLDHNLAETIEFGLEMDESCTQLQLAFELAMVGISDCWRRLVLEFSGPPFCLFSLIGLTAAEFVRHWKSLHRKFQKCNGCFDDAFSRMLLRTFPLADFQNKSAGVQEALAVEVQQVLADIATWAPVSSDMVEIKHGVVQWSVSRRGKQQIKNPTAARETTLLQACIKQFAFVRESVQEDVLPSKRVSSGILKMVGTRGSGPHSKEKGLRQRTAQETPGEREARTSEAATRTVRTLCGWNIYQQEQMKSTSPLKPEEYKIKVKEWGARWRSMSREQKQPYNVEASHQSNLRTQLAELPLASKSEAKAMSSGQEVSERQQDRARLESEVGRKGCKKLSARRLTLNMEAEKSHSLWSSDVQYADSHLPSEMLRSL